MKEDDTPEIHALTEALDEIATHCRDGILSSLTMRVAVIKKDGERILPAKYDRNRYHRTKTVWQCTTKTVNTVVYALAASKLRIASLGFFSDSDMQLCSIACDQLNTIDWDASGLTDSLSTLSSLSIRMSARVFEFEEYYDGYKRKRPENWAQVRAEGEERSNFPGLSRLFALCCNLKNFDVIYSRTRTTDPAGPGVFRSEKILQHIVKDIKKLPILKSCKLRGFSAREEDLLEFLKRTQASEVLLECINLRFGSFRSIFDYCTSAEAGIKKLYFDSLYDRGGQKVFFDSKTIRHNMSQYPKPYDASKREEEKQPPWSHDVLMREGTKVTDPIVYPVPAPMIPGNPWSSQRHIFQSLEYGSG